MSCLEKTGLAGQKILVSGVTGFVGGALVEALAKTGATVIGLCRDLEKGQRKFAALGSAIECRHWDMAKPLPYADRVDAIIHAAGKGDPISYAKQPARTMREHFLGCTHILDFAATQKTVRFVLISSGEVYGSLTREDRIKEMEQGIVPPLTPRSAYPVSKMAAESLALAYGREYGISISIARLCHVYGPGIHPDDSRIAALFPLAAARQQNIVMKSAGEQLRSLCYIDDAAAAVLTIIEKGRTGEAYNIADQATELTVRQFAEHAAQAGGVQVAIDMPLATEAAAFNPMPRAVFSTDKLQALGWTARTGIDEGMRNTLAYFQRLEATEKKP